MTPEQMQKIVDGAPEGAKYVRKTSGMTHYSEAYFVGATSIEKLRTQLAKREPMDLRDADIPHGTIILEK